MNKYSKMISLSFCVIFLLSVTCMSCGKRTNVTVAAAPAIDLKELTSKIEHSAGKLPEMSTYSTDDKDAEDWFKYLCDFDYSKVDDYYISYSSSGTAEELFLIKLKDGADSTYAELALHNRIKARIATFDQYQPEEVSKLGNAIVTSNGNYTALLICQDEYSAKKAFQDAFSTK